jgi:hypothetical protein
MRPRGGAAQAPPALPGIQAAEAAFRVGAAQANVILR